MAPPEDSPQLGTQVNPVSVEIDENAAAALHLVARQAELWDADWQGVDGTSGKIGLPITAGLRRGWVEGTVRSESLGAERSRLVFEPEHDEYRIDRGSVMILGAAAFGCLITMVAMFVPKILPLLPMGILLAFGGYLVVIARLRNSGPEEFLESVVSDHQAD